jgi:hypothetical protein
MAWMWSALLAASLAAWPHQLTAAIRSEDILIRPRRPQRQGRDRHPPDHDHTGVFASESVKPAAIRRP